MRISGELPTVPTTPLLSPLRGTGGTTHLLALIGFGILGVFVAAGGTISLPVGGAVSALWPAVALQFVLALWFGWAGVLVGVLFPFFANLLVADLLSAVAFTPANFVQAAVPLLIFKIFQGHTYCYRARDLFLLALSSLVAPSLAAVLGVSLQRVLLGEAGGGLLQVKTWLVTNALCGFFLSLPMLRWLSPVLWELKETERLGKGFAFGWHLVGGTFTLAGFVVAAVNTFHLLPTLGMPLRFEILPRILGIGFPLAASGVAHLLWKSLATPLYNLVRDTELASQGTFPKTTVGGEPAELMLLRERFSEVISALVEEHQRFKNIFLTVGDPILLVDPQGKLLDANTAFEKVFNVPVALTRGRNVLAFVDRQLRAKVLAFLQREAPREPVAFRGRVLAGDGSWRHVHLTIAPWRDSRGIFTGFSAVTTDITRHEEEAQQAALAARMASLEHLLAGLAHEGNNVLQAASSQLETLTLSHQELAPQLHGLWNSLIRAKKLIEEVVVLSGKLDRLPTETFSTRELLDEVSEAANAYPDKTLNLCAQGRYPMVRGPRALLRRAVEALVENAFEASPPSAPVTVALEEKHITHMTEKLSLQPGDYVVIEVRDQGHGIQPEHLPFIFDPFFTTHDRTSHQGVGLSIARAAAIKTGGDLTVESTPGRGTVVRLWLPTVPKEDADKGVDAPGKVRVLLVDDDRQVLEALQASLSASGIEVEAADNGKDALSLAERQVFDVVLLDLLMPEISGFDVLATLRHHSKGLPIVLQSGYAPDERLRQALAEPFTFYLQKPYTLRQLEETIGKALKAKRVSLQGE